MSLCRSVLFDLHARRQPVNVSSQLMAKEREPTLDGVRHVLSLAETSQFGGREHRLRSNILRGVQWVPLVVRQILDSAVRDLCASAGNVDFAVR